MWSWGVETATHALRIVFSGVFDRFPGATLVLGHIGESLPGMLWRLDSRWEFINRRGLKLGKERPSDYIRENIMITTSGVCAQAPLLGSLLALGAAGSCCPRTIPWRETPKPSPSSTTPRSARPTGRRSATSTPNAC